MSVTFNPHRFSHIPAIYKDTDIVNAIIEIPKGTTQKYEWDESINMYVLDRTLPSTLPYPMSYGFIPNTYAADGDNLDICIYASEAINRDTLARVKIVCALDLIDNGDRDYKLIGVLESNPNASKYNDFCDLDQLVLEHTKNFFALYKLKTGKKVDIMGWINKDDTVNILNESIAQYDKNKMYKDMRINIDK